MTLYLKILPIPEGFPGLDSDVLLLTSLPLKIDLGSEYVIDADTGLIVQHELIESCVKSGNWHLPTPYRNGSGNGKS
jgi:hypothetical protein